MGRLEPQPQGGALYRPDKGETPNPAGKPKGVPHSRTRLKRLLELTENLTNPITKEVEGFTVAEQLDLAQIIKARKGDTNAYNTIMDRLEGKPKQETKVEITKSPAREVLEAAGLIETEGKDDRQADSDNDRTPASQAQV